MIKKLRKRVVALTMVAVFIVLILLMGIVNLANYISSDRAVDEILDLLEENGGSFPLFGKHGDVPQGGLSQGDGTGQGNTADQSNATTDSDSPGDNWHPPKGDFKDGLKPGMSKETPFETRYFSVILDGDSNLVYMDTTRIATVSTDQALEISRSVLKGNKTSGYTNQSGIIYKYRKVNLEDGNAMLIFVNATRDINSVKNFLLISFLVSLGGFILIGALVIALSPMMIKPITESYEKQKKFITNAGHELKTPLAVIKSCNEVMEMESGETKWTKAIEEQVDRMTDLTSHLVALSKMDEASELEGDLIKEPLNFSELFKETLSPFSIVAEQKDLKFTYSTSSDNITIKGNRSSLTELINILADNAIKYCSPDGEIVFTLSQKGSRIILTEENPGENLTKGNQNILFDRFFRGDQSHTSDDNGGYGIGLSMAQAIVTAHGGTITAESPEDNRLLIKATF